MSITATRLLALGLVFTTACSSCGSNTAGAPSVPDGSPSASAAAGPTGCKPLVVTPGAMVDGSKADTFAWYDSACLLRTASLLRNDAKDAYGERGGYMRAISYQVAGATRDIRGTGTNGWQGFGYIVDHYGGGSTAVSSNGVGGTYRTLLAGRHHAIHEFKWDLSPGGTLHVTAHWMFATGRSHPLFAITLDTSANRAGTVHADSRSPYGDMAWDNGVAGDVSGNGWGDTHKFTTTSGPPLTQSAAWDYTKANIVPYTYEWSTPTDAEMGLVATLSWASRIQGGDYFGGDLMNTKWGKTGTNLLSDLPASEWPYQLNQYELPSTSKSHRLAWGLSLGAVGDSSYTAFGKTLSGYPYQSYTVYIVLGTHAPSAVAAQVSEVEAQQGVMLTATRGTVATDGVGGPGRADKVTFPQRGFDPLYAAWTLDAESNAVSVSIATGSGKLANPLFEIRDYTAASAPATVTYGGHPLVADRDYFATVDATGQRLWLTLNQTIAGTETLTVN